MAKNAIIFSGIKDNIFINSFSKYEQETNKSRLKS